MRLPDGFPGQRLRVLPAPVAAEALRRPPTSGLLVTDAGFFPKASNHGRQRVSGTAETIVIVCTDGAGYARVAGRTATVTAGTALVLAPGQPHAYWSESGNPWTIWWVHVTGSHVAGFTDSVLAGAGSALVTLDDPYRAVSVIDDAITCLENDETVPTLVSAAGAGYALLAQLTADAAAGGSGRAEPVRQAQDHLRRHFDKPVDVAELARTAGLSTSHFSALFRAATGGGVLEYAKRLRMASARELLITSTRSIGDIAATVGYRDAFYFSRQFRTVHGCSPSEYRGMHRHGEDIDGP